MRAINFCEMGSVLGGAALATVLFFTGCHRSVSSTPPQGAGADTAADRQPSACEMILAPQGGEDRPDREIARQQANVRNERNVVASLERLGWLYVAKARESFDPGYYKLAQQCAECLESHQPQLAEALLLQGHVLQNLHQFKAAEAVAQKLVTQRGRSFDYGLLGDALMEQGKLAAAAAAYQQMVDERPDLQAYARIAHLRWLKGDTAGALEVIELAADAASPAAPEAAAWVHTRWAWLQLQQGSLEAAARNCATALDYQRNYAPALGLQGRLFLAQGRTAEAVAALTRAVQLCPLPDYQWQLSEALREAGEETAATLVESNLLQQGTTTDPRTLALFLASRGTSASLSLRLARAELDIRADVYTHDALAWSLAANGEIRAAREEINRALMEGTHDARFFLHAAVIALRAGIPREAEQWLAKSARLRSSLLPSEQRLWRHTASELKWTDLGAEGSEAHGVTTPTSVHES